ncbi:hypothetical protein QTL95_24480 [Rhizobium sp. S152]|uniref:hypothetical protein n=1 Tax=Rhizobium sp. S152 TaxID=3055038 RepID=UPI0025A955F1|nr:hypothetical protein [Rhizobium sp. S152]MDM9629053.1 hypothetical protein [Rhizobium sp. S152]
MDHIKELLIGLRDRASRIDAPMLVYLLDMAIVEADDTIRGAPTIAGRTDKTRGDIASSLVEPKKT